MSGAMDQNDARRAGYDLDKHVARTPMSRIAQPAWPEPPDVSAFYGLAGDFVRLIAPQSEADCVALLLQFLVAFGNVVGRNPHFRVEDDLHHCNIFAVLVGATSHGRKGLAWGRTRPLFASLDADWSDCIHSGLSSGEGLIWAVRDPIMRQEKTSKKGAPPVYTEVVGDPGVDDKRLLVVEGEFASTLRVLQRDGNTLSPVVRNAWDCREVLQTMTKNSPAKATDPHISIIGHITKDEVHRCLDRTELANGFANRFLWVCVRRAQLLPEGGDLAESHLDPLIAQLRARITFARSVMRVQFDGEARALWYAAYPRLSGDRPGMFGAVTARAEPQCLRLALIYALLDGSSTIGVAHLRAAFGLWSYCEESARCIFGDALGDSTADEILRALRANPEGLTRTSLRDLFSRNRSGDDIGRALALLVGQGLAHSEAVPTGGKPAELWRATTRTTETTEGVGQGGLRSFRSFLLSVPGGGALDVAPPCLADGTSALAARPATEMRPRTTENGHAGPEPPHRSPPLQAAGLSSN